METCFGGGYHPIPVHKNFLNIVAWAHQWGRINPYHIDQHFIYNDILGVKAPQPLAHVIDYFRKRLFSERLPEYKNYKKLFSEIL